MSGTAFLKSFDRMKSADGFSNCKNGNISVVARVTSNEFIEEDSNGVFFLSEGDLVAFVGKSINRILNPN